MTEQYPVSDSRHRGAPAQRELSRQLIAPLPGAPAPRKTARRASATILVAVGILAAGTTVWGGWQLQGADLAYELEQRSLREELATQVTPADTDYANESAVAVEEPPPSENAGVEIITVAGTPNGKAARSGGEIRTGGGQGDRSAGSSDSATVSAAEDVYLPGSTSSESGSGNGNGGNGDSSREGKPVGLISIPSIGVDSVLVWGVSLEALEKGPGIMPQRSMPGQHGNAVISGHRNIHGGVFYKLDKLKYGDKIIVTYQGEEHVYEVRGTDVVDPDDVSVVRQTRGVRLTLTTCTPIGTDRYRLIIQAELVEGPLEGYALDRGDWKFSR